MAQGESQDEKKEWRWPWDWTQAGEPPGAVLAKIIHNLPWYALDVLEKKPEEVGMADSLHVGYQTYCTIAKDYFDAVVKEAADPEKAERLSKIAGEASALVDSFLGWVDILIKRRDAGFPSVYVPDEPYSPIELWVQWDSARRAFEMETAVRASEPSRKARKHGRGKLDEEVKNLPE
jgi:hypothetical protein